MTSASHRWSRPRLGWWAVVLAVLVLAVNAASIWEIAVARRTVREHARQALERETEALARDVAADLASTRTDLAFLAGVLPGAEERAGIERAGAALLLFLRGHDHVMHLRLGSPAGPLVEAGRPRGVPGYWVHGGRTAEASESPDCSIETALPIAGPAGATELEACVAPSALLGGDLACTLDDGAGRRLAGDDRAKPTEVATVELSDVSGWNAPAPWRIACAFARAPVGATFEPLVARQRTTVLLNLAVMLLAALLGWLAFEQTRRRQRVEARAHEEARVREIERQLFHAERLSTVGRLAAGMAHEINNPLEGMANYLRLTRDALARGEHATAERQLAQVDHGLAQVAAIVRRVLDHSGRGPSPETRIDLRDVIVQAIEFVRVRDEFRTIEFDLDLGALPAHVRGSSVTLGQVFLNLALNACEAQPKGGAVLVRCRVEDGAVVAEVVDRGPGVPQAARGRIFEPFESTKESLGLGLSICHSIVAEHVERSRSTSGRGAARSSASGYRASRRCSVSGREAVRGRVLVVEDEPYVRASLGELLTSRGYDVRLEESAESALRWLARAPVDVVLTDLRLGATDGLDLVRRVRAIDAELPIVILTGHGTISSAVDCVRAGAADYLLKPADPDALEVCLDRARDTRALRREVTHLRTAGDTTDGGPIGASAAWRTVVQRVQAAAASDATVLLTGESGTGKEVLARLLHKASPRSGRAFVGVNCSAVPLDMWESEFFGHRRGAFTGATADRDGRFLLAHQGTLFMDEIGTMPLAAQAKILRALESGEFDRLGDERPTNVDVRIVAATNSDLEGEVKASRFRQDLYFRLNVLRIAVPPLRERTDDIGPLTEHFVRRISARLGRPAPEVEPAVLADLKSYPWPGNVRELRNVIERALILNPGDTLASLDLPPLEGPRRSGPADESDLSLRTRLSAVEREIVLEALKRSNGVRKEAARLLGIDPRNLPYYLRKHGIDASAIDG